MTQKMVDREKADFYLLLTIILGGANILQIPEMPVTGNDVKDGGLGEG